MSYGIVMCSICHREVHQDGPRDNGNGWRHCEDRSIICTGGQASYPESVEQIKGKWCGRDGFVKPVSIANKITDYPTGKAGRNDPCPCGSGKKYKRCCQYNHIW